MLPISMMKNFDIIKTGVAIVLLISLLGNVWFYFYHSSNKIDEVYMDIVKSELKKVEAKYDEMSADIAEVLKISNKIDSEYATISRKIENTDYYIRSNKILDSKEPITEEEGYENLRDALRDVSQ